MRASARSYLDRVSVLRMRTDQARTARFSTAQCTRLPKGNVTHNRAVVCVY
jgi:hypothetical protein